MATPYLNELQHYIDLAALAQRVLQVDASGNPIVPTGGLATETTQLGVKSDLDERYAGGKTAIGVTLTSSGNNVVVTPTTGHALKIVWVSIIPSGDNLNANLVKVKFGVGGTPLYQSYVLAHWEAFTGGVDVPLVVNCQTSEAVAVTIHYREI